MTPFIVLATVAVVFGIIIFAINRAAAKEEKRLNEQFTKYIQDAVVTKTSKPSYTGSVSRSSAAYVPTPTVSVQHSRTYYEAPVDTTSTIVNAIVIDEIIDSSPSYDTTPVYIAPDPTPSYDSGCSTSYTPTDSGSSYDFGSSSSSCSYDSGSSYSSYDSGSTYDSGGSSSSDSSSW